MRIAPCMTPHRASRSNEKGAFRPNYHAILRIDTTFALYLRTHLRHPG